MSQGLGDILWCGKPLREYFFDFKFDRSVIPFEVKASYIMSEEYELDCFKFDTLAYFDYVKHSLMPWMDDEQLYFVVVELGAEVGELALANIPGLKSGYERHLQVIKTQEVGKEVSKPQVQIIQDEFTESPEQVQTFSQARESSKLSAVGVERLLTHVSVDRDWTMQSSTRTSLSQYSEGFSSFSAGFSESQLIIGEMLLRTHYQGYLTSRHDKNQWFLPASSIIREDFETIDWGDIVEFSDIGVVDYKFMIMRYFLNESPDIRKKILTYVLKRKGKVLIKQVVSGGSVIPRGASLATVLCYMRLHLALVVFGDKGDLGQIDSLFSAEGSGLWNVDFHDPFFSDSKLQRGVKSVVSGYTGDTSYQVSWLSKACEKLHVKCKKTMLTLLFAGEMVRVRV